MGTSQSSKGAPPKVPLVPPWANNGTPQDSPDSKPNDTPLNPENQVPGKPPIAPERRFYGARTNLNKFASTGNKTDLKRGLEHYVKTGYGGSRTTTQRLSRTITTAGALFNVLSYNSSGQPSGMFPEIDFNALRGKTFDQITDAIIEAIRPIDGDLDSEASQRSMKDAFSELLGKYENANLLDLTEEQRFFVVEKFIAGDVFTRFDLDMGKGIRKKASSPASALSRLKEARDYIKETVSSSFKKIDKTIAITSKTIVSVIKDTLEDAFHVFESYTI
jgi:hypothetical protein